MEPVRRLEHSLPNMKNLVVSLFLVLFCLGAAYGACRPTACPAVFDPICAKRVINGRSEFRTFGNTCNLNSCPEGFKFLRKGECGR